MRFSSSRDLSGQPSYESAGLLRVIDAREDLASMRDPAIRVSDAGLHRVPFHLPGVRLRQRPLLAVAVPDDLRRFGKVAIVWLPVEQRTNRLPQQVLIRLSREETP